MGSEIKNSTLKASSAIDISLNSLTQHDRHKSELIHDAKKQVDGVMNEPELKVKLKEKITMREVERETRHENVKQSKLQQKAQDKFLKRLVYRDEYNLVSEDVKERFYE